MANLLQETEEILAQNGKSLSDIEWWGCRKFKLPNNKMRELLNVNYDSGFGGQEIATDLILVGNGFWLERGEYDGSEWWDFHTAPVEPEEKRESAQLHLGLWSSLSDTE